MQFSQEECGRLRRAFIIWLLNQVDLIIALSPEWERDIRTLTTNPRVVVLRNPTLMKPLAMEDVKSRVRGQLLFLGRLEQKKGIYDLLEAIALLRFRHPEIRLLCGGDGEIEQVRKCTHDLGIEEHVLLLGWIRGGEKDALLASSAAYILPSYKEGLPMGLLEAMASGLPVVSTAVGGIPDAVDDGREGFLVSPGDVRALAEAIGRILEDDELRERLGSAARAKVDATFSADCLLPQLEEIYRAFSIR